MRMNNNSHKEIIELSLPINAVYVASARMTASSIANRMNFHIEEIEDIKSAVSEICTFIIKKVKPNKESTFKISFGLLENSLEVEFEVKEEFSIDNSENEMSIVMIKALTDNMTITHNNGLTIWTIEKNHKPHTF